MVGGNSSQKSGGHQQSSSSSSSQNQQNNPNFDTNAISERVKNLATQIYQELKRIISRCNYDEDILSGLMPLIVRVLESLDLALIENQQLQVELELCKDDNEQLVIMFEKEKAAKRAIDKKLIESEYAYEEERQQHQQKIESLDHIVKMFELKAKNASDQATRFEEKEAERKKEYNKLHDRYTELLKSHCDVVERFRHLAGNTEIANLTSINVPQQMVVSSSDLTINDLQAHHISKTKLKSDDTDFEKGTVASSIGTRSEALKSWNAEIELTLEDASLGVIEDIGIDSHKSTNTATGTGDASSHNESDRATSEPEGEHEKESENDSIAYTSMEKEFRKLIQENKDLLNTKNALNVVKDDLIAEVDRLTNEVSMYERAVEQLNSTKDKMKQKVSFLDAELRQTKEELEKAKQKLRENNEEGVPYAQRKRFGRAEMAKVLMERNNYKERFMELQDAVRYTELVRANKVEMEKRSGLWKFFNNLFGPPPREQLAIGAAGQSTSRNSSPGVSYHGSPAASDQLASVGSGGSLMVGGNQFIASDALQSSVGRGNSSIRSNNRLSNNSDMIVLMDSDLNIDRKRANKDRSGRLSSDMSGYIHAYGWSLPASSFKALAAGSDNNDSDSSVLNASRGSALAGTSSYSGPETSILALGGELTISGSKLPGLQVPIPQYCRPLTGDSLGMKIWCATAIDLSGGEVAQNFDGQRQQQLMSPSNSQAREATTVNSSGSLVNISTSTPIKSPNSQQALKMLEQEVDKALNEQEDDRYEYTNTDDNSFSRRPILKTTTEMVMSAIPMADDSEDMSSCVWMCSTQHSRSKITIIDIETKPNDLLDSFYVPTFLYCIKTIPGCKPSDLLGITSFARAEEKRQSTDQQQPQRSQQETQRASITLNMIDELIANQKREFYKLIEVSSEPEHKFRQKKRVEFKDLPSKGDESSGAAQDASELQGKTSDADSKSRCEEDEDDADAEISRILDNNISDGFATLQKLNDFVAHIQPQVSQDQAEPTDDQVTSQQQKPQNQPAGDEQQSEKAAPVADQPSNRPVEVVYYQPISTCLSTVWMGGKDSVLYIHSAIGQWKDCVAYVKLRDSILQICHFRGRVFVALADGTLCVFFRNIESRQWEFSHYLLIDINLMVEVMNDATDVTETSLSSAADLQQSRLYSGSNKQTSSGASTSSQQASTSASLSDQLKEAAAAESQTQTPTRLTKSSASRNKVAGIRCLEIANKNLWVGYKNRVLIIDPITLRLRHAFNVVPQVDNQVRQLISMKDGVFCCLRSDLILRLYSSLKPYQHIQNTDIEPVVTRLISPKTFVISHITAMKVADNTLWIGNAHGIILTIPCKLMPQISEAPTSGQSGEFEEASSSLSIARYVPICDITNAQISFHGHKDAVKFFINAHNLMLSGGQGYLDFRLDMDDQSKSISDKSHVILWQLPK